MKLNSLRLCFLTVLLLIGASSVDAQDTTFTTPTMPTTESGDIGDPDGDPTFTTPTMPTTESDGLGGPDGDPIFTTPTMPTTESDGLGGPDGDPIFTTPTMPTTESDGDGDPDGDPTFTTPTMPTFTTPTMPTTEKDDDDGDDPTFTTPTMPTTDKDDDGDDDDDKDTTTVYSMYTTEASLDAAEFNNVLNLADSIPSFGNISDQPANLSALGEAVGQVGSLLANLANASVSTAQAGEIAKRLTSSLGSTLTAFLVPGAEETATSNADKNTFLTQALGAVDKVGIFLNSKSSSSAGPIVVNTPGLSLAVFSGSSGANVSSDQGSLTFDSNTSVPIQLAAFKANPYSSVSTNPTSVNSSCVSLKDITGSTNEASFTASLSASTPLEENNYELDSSRPLIHSYEVTECFSFLQIQQSFSDENSNYTVTSSVNSSRPLPGESPVEIHLNGSDLTVVANEYNFSVTFDPVQRILVLLIPTSNVNCSANVVMMVTSSGGDNSTSTSSASVRKKRATGGTSYTAGSMVYSPKIWDPVANKWVSSASLEILPDSNGGTIKFKSNFMGSFASGLFVPPNTIDFDSVFDDLGAKTLENPAVLIVVCTLIVAYFLLLIPAYYGDKRDRVKWNFEPILENAEGDEYVYRLQFITGRVSPKQSSCDIYIVLYGEHGNTLPRLMDDGFRKNFGRGSATHLIMTYPEDIGRLSYAHIWTTGDDDKETNKIFLSKLTVQDLNHGRSYAFTCESWLTADGDGKGQMNRLCLSQEENHTSVAQLLSDNMRNRLFDEHLWLSVVARPNPSNFTRVQRLSLCLSTLFLSMIANAMWFNTSGEADTSAGLTIGPIRLTWNQFFIGMMGSLLVLPPNFIIITLFRRCKPYEPLTESSRVFKMTNDKRASLLLPWWGIVFAYVLVGVCIANGAWWCYLYSIQWGQTVSTDWLISLVLSFSQSVLFVQPIKVALLVMVVSCFMGGYHDYSPSEIVVHRTVASCTMRDWPIGTEPKIRIIPHVRPSLEFKSEQKVLTDQVSSTMKDAILNIGYLVLVLIIVNHNRSPWFFYLNHTIRQTIYTGGSEPGGGEEVLPWLKSTVFQAVYPVTSYNGDPLSAYDQQFLRDMPGALLLGPVRLHQARFRKSTNCDLEGIRLESSKWTIPTCDHKEPDTTHHTIGWYNETQEVVSEPFSFQKVSGLSIEGELDTYPSDGYTISMTRSTYSGAIDWLQSLHWVDNGTRMVSAQFVINTGQVNAFTSVKVLVEFPTMGGLVQSDIVRSFRPYPYVDTWDFIFLVAQCAWGLMTIGLLILEILDWWKEGCRAYFRGVWHWVRLTCIFTGFSTILFFTLRTMEIIKRVEYLKNNQGEYTDFDQVQYWDECYSLAAAFHLFLLIVSLYKPMSFHLQLHTLKSALRLAAKPLLSYMALFAVVLLWFAHTFYFSVGWRFQWFSSLGSSAFTLLGMMLGMIPYGSVIEEDEAIFRVLFILFMFVGNMILINAFIAVINFSMAESQAAKPEELGFDVGFNSHIHTLASRWWGAVKGDSRLYADFELLDDNLDEDGKMNRHIQHRAYRLLIREVYHQKRLDIEVVDKLTEAMSIKTRQMMKEGLSVKQNMHPIDRLLKEFHIAECQTSGNTKPVGKNAQHLVCTNLDYWFKGGKKTLTQAAKYLIQDLVRSNQGERILKIIKSDGSSVPRYQLAGPVKTGQTVKLPAPNPKWTCMDSVSAVWIPAGTMVKFSTCPSHIAFPPRNGSGQVNVLCKLYTSSEFDSKIVSITILSQDNVSPHIQESGHGSIETAGATPLNQTRLSWPSLETTYGLIETPNKYMRPTLSSSNSLAYSNAFTQLAGKFIAGSKNGFQPPANVTPSSAIVHVWLGLKNHVNTKRADVFRKVDHQPWSVAYNRVTCPEALLKVPVQVGEPDECVHVAAKYRDMSNKPTWTAFSSSLSAAKKLSPRSGPSDAKTGMKMRALNRVTNMQGRLYLMSEGTPRPHQNHK